MDVQQIHLQPTNKKSPHHIQFLPGSPKKIEALKDVSFQLILWLGDKFWDRHVILSQG